MGLANHVVAMTLSLRREHAILEGQLGKSYGEKHAVRLKLSNMDCKITAFV